MSRGILPVVGEYGHTSMVLLPADALMDAICSKLLIGPCLHSVPASC
jgi:hypothetical protein